MNRQTLHKLMTEKFNADELKSICFELDVDFENVCSNDVPKYSQVQNIIQYFERRDRLGHLLANIIKERPYAFTQADKYELEQISKEELYGSLPDEISLERFTDEVGPTLFIGLGDTGQNLLTRLKTLYYQTLGQIPAGLKFLAIDIEDRIHAQSLQRNIIKLDDNVEFLKLDFQSTKNIIEGLHLYPHIQEWLNKNEQPPHFYEDIAQGTLGFRPIGRLRLFFSYKPILDKITTILQQLTHVTIPYSATLKIFVISSACGGTGSAIFLDIAYLIRHAFNRLHRPAINCVINTILTLPSENYVAQDNLAQANTYATFLEIQHAARYGWKCQYANLPDLHNKPYDYIFLVDIPGQEGGIDLIQDDLVKCSYLLSTGWRRIVAQMEHRKACIPILSTDPKLLHVIGLRFTEYSQRLIIQEIDSFNDIKHKLRNISRDLDTSLRNLLSHSFTPAEPLKQKLLQKLVFIH